MDKLRQEVKESKFIKFATADLVFIKAQLLGVDKKALDELTNSKEETDSCPIYFKLNFKEWEYTSDVANGLKWKLQDVLTSVSSVDIKSNKLNITVIYTIIVLYMYITIIVYCTHGMILFTCFK